MFRKTFMTSRYQMNEKYQSTSKNKDIKKNSFFTVHLIHLYKLYDTLLKMSELFNIGPTFFLKMKINQLISKFQFIISIGTYERESDSIPYVTIRISKDQIRFKQFYVFRTLREWKNDASEKHI